MSIFTPGQILTAAELNSALAAKPDASALAGAGGAATVGTSTGQTVEVRLAADETVLAAHGTRLSTDETNISNNATAITAETTRATAAELAERNRALAAEAALLVLTPNAISAAYTLAATDLNGRTLVRAVAAQTVTIPKSTTLALPLNTPVLFKGLITVAPATGVTMTSNGTSNGGALADANSMAFAIQTATDVWELYGRLS